jgi:quinol monooxygenase YgiN
MIKEVACITIDVANRELFENAVQQAVPAFHGAAGCHGVKLERSVDHPGRYLLIVEWESVDAHMVDFRGSPAFQTWRSLVGPFFLSPPDVDHTEIAITGF